MTTITGLEAFGLSSDRLARLGNRTTRLLLYLDAAEITSEVIARESRRRHEYLEQRTRRRIDSIRRRFPAVSFVRGDDQPPSALYARVPAQREARRQSLTRRLRRRGPATRAADRRR